MLGIDVSENNSLINWQDVVDAGCKFAIIRSSYGRTNEDEMFTLSVQAAHAAGLKCGAYHYSYALTPEQAIEEAAHCAEIINASGELLELPVFFDMEDADQYKANHGFEFSGENVTEICRSFITSLGLKCGVYASESWFDNYIDYESLHCPVWNAAYINHENFYSYPVGGVTGWFLSFQLQNWYFDATVNFINIRLVPATTSTILLNPYTNDTIAAHEIDGVLYELGIH